MNLELGETYSTQFKVTDSTGAPGSATVTVSVLLPDGTSAVVTPSIPVTGSYNIDYATSQLGRHEIYVSATGGVLGTLVRKTTDVINVDPVSSGALISLSDIKEHLNIPAADTDHDQELAGMLLVASRFVESKTQLWHTTTATETHTKPGRAILLACRPVRAVTSLIDQDGNTIASTLYSISASSGVILLQLCQWLWNSQVTVVYTAGASYVPPDVRHAVKVVLAHLWRTQRGNSVIGQAGPDDVWDPRFGFSYPRAVQEMLEAYSPGVVVA